VTLIVAGQSGRNWWQHITRGSVVDKLVNNTMDIDVLVVSFNDQRANKPPRP
jgi:K+-sensing histidine kinase KdpD